MAPMLRVRVTVTAIITMNIDQLQLLQLLQLTSPSLPIGGFSWSQGLESAIDQGWLKNENDLLEWLQGTAQHSFIYQEWPLLTRLMKSTQLADTEQQAYWNHVSLALRETAELRQEDVQMGAALLKLSKDMDIPQAQQWQQSETSYITAFAMVATSKQIELQAACTGLIWSWLENQIAAALKAFPMGQTAGQRIFHKIVENIPSWYQQSCQVTDEEIGFSVPGVVLASMQHENQYSRLFRS